MTDTKRVITVDDFEHRLLVGCLTTAHNKYIEDGKPVEGVNELIIKTIDAPRRRGLRLLLSPSSAQKYDRSVASPLPTKSDDFAGAPNTRKKRRIIREGR